MKDLTEGTPEKVFMEVFHPHVYQCDFPAAL